MDKLGNCVGCERIQGISEFIQNHQQYAMVKHHLNRLIQQCPLLMLLFAQTVRLQLSLSPSPLSHLPSSICLSLPPSLFFVLSLHLSPSFPSLPHSPLLSPSLPHSATLPVFMLVKTLFRWIFGHPLSPVSPGTPSLLLTCTRGRERTDHLLSLLSRKEGI